MIRADKLFKRGQGLSQDRFGFWLCYVYGVAKNSFTEGQLDLIEKDLEKCENASKQE